jgi:hypothetical protein
MTVEGNFVGSAPALGTVQVELFLESTPQGARVYLVPLLFWEDNGEEALMKDENRLKDFRVSEGATNQKTFQKQAVFWAVFYREGKKAALKCEVNEIKKENKCAVTKGDWK